MGLISIVLEVVRSIVVSGGAVPVRMMMVGIGMVATGGLWIVSGAMFWKRWWWIAVILLFVGYAVGVFTFSRMR